MDIIALQAVTQFHEKLDKLLAANKEILEKLQKIMDQVVQKTVNDLAALELAKVQKRLDDMLIDVSAASYRL